MSELSEIPDSLFMVKWSAFGNPEQIRTDFLELHGKEWHWFSRENGSSQRLHNASASSLEQISGAYGAYFGEGAAESAEFLCAPRIGDDLINEKEVFAETFPLDVILNEIAHIFSRTSVSALEYGDRRKWFIWRSSYFRPNSVGDMKAPRAHHLFWFPLGDLPRLPKLLYFNVRPPQPSKSGMRWSAWEIALKVNHLILHSYWDVDLATGATASILDTSSEGMSPLEFLSSSSPSWKMRPDGSLADAWGHLVMKSPEEWDSLGLEILPDSSE